MIIYSIIPARKGSKGIVNKNIMKYKDIPLIAHSIIQSNNSKYINKTFVSTDSEEYLNIASKYGSIIPILRPENISSDNSNDIDFLKHFLDYLEETNDKCDLIVQLRPTSPERKLSDIDSAIEAFINEYDKYDSLRSVIEMDKSAFKTYYIADNTLIPLVKEYVDINEPYNIGRQQLPQTYIHNGYIDIMKPITIKKYDSITGQHILPYVMNNTETIDIDKTEDIHRKCE